MKAGLPKLAAAMMLPTLVAACANSPLPSLSTGSVAGAAQPAAAPVAEEPKSDPTSRAFQVGSTSARAVKCGYNFDPAKLKGQFLAAETAAGVPVADIGKVEKIYDVSFNGISRGIAEKADYCSDEKSKEIKADLTRHLAGDYTPKQKKVVAQKDEGMFSGFFDGGDDTVDNGPKMGTPEWWEKQKEKAGK